MFSRKIILIIILFLVVVISLLYYTGTLNKAIKTFSKPEAKICTLIGCGPNSSISSIFFDAPLSFEELIKSHIQFCQNFKCSTITFDNIKEVPKPYTGWGGIADGEGVEADIMADKNGKFFIGLRFYGRGFFGKSIGRDRYSVVLINSQGETVLKLSKWMGYEAYHPNGRGCGPACYSSIFDNQEQTIPWH
jgi:hypothetical protein